MRGVKRRGPSHDVARCALWARRMGWTGRAEHSGQSRARHLERIMAVIAINCPRDVRRSFQFITV
eukprot:scaffold131865_cov87-Phaeocystis_antarctica.AAC.3